MSADLPGELLDFGVGEPDVVEEGARTSPLGEFERRGGAPGCVDGDLVRVGGRAGPRLPQPPVGQVEPVLLDAGDGVGGEVQCGVVVAASPLCPSPDGLESAPLLRYVSGLGGVE